MGLLTHPFKTLRRFRTSRGFGVHSPFAFDFITKVLRLHDVAYYAYPEIDSFCMRRGRGVSINNLGFKAGSYDRREARMTFRLLCHFNPATVLEVGQGSEAMRTIIDRAVPHAKALRWSREKTLEIDNDKMCVVVVEYVIEDNYHTMRRYLLELMDHNPQLVICFRNLDFKLNRRLWEEFSAVMTYGMTFHDDYIAICCLFPRLPLQSFELEL